LLLPPHARRNQIQHACMDMGDPFFLHRHHYDAAQPQAGP
jgi:hypothetical protein